MSVKLLGSFFVSTGIFVLFNLRYTHMKKRLETAQRVQTDALIDLCHALRTPLTTISGIAEIFKGAQGNLDAGQKQLIPRLTSSAAALKNLISGSLVFKREMELPQPKYPDRFRKFLLLFRERCLA